MEVCIDIKMIKYLIIPHVFLTFAPTFELMKFTIYYTIIFLTWLVPFNYLFYNTSHAISWIFFSHLNGFWEYNIRYATETHSRMYFLTTLTFLSSPATENDRILVREGKPQISRAQYTFLNVCQLLTHISL